MHVPAKPIVRFDMDGTIFDFPEKLARLLEKDKQLPKDVREKLADVENRTKDDVWELFPDPNLQKIVKKQVEQTYQTQEFFESLAPYPGVKKTLLELDKQFHIGFLSKPSHAFSGSHSGKAITIQRFFGKNFEKNRLVLTGNKTLVGGHILVDDTWSVQKNDDTPQHIPSRQLILLDQPRNKHILGQPRLYLSQQNIWAETIREVLSLKYQKDKEYSTYDVHREQANVLSTT